MVKVTLENKEIIDYEIKNAVQAMRTCYSSNHLSDNLGNLDKELLRRAVRTGHHTPLEFITLTFNVEGLVRACFSEDTEVLTDKGFKLFSDLDGSELVATRNIHGVVEYQKPTMYHKYWKEEFMHRYKSQTIDLLVTKNHRMLYKRNKADIKTEKGRDEIYLKESEDIKHKRVNFIKTFNKIEESQIEDTILIKGYNYDKKNNNGTTRSVYTGDLKIGKVEWLRFLALYLSDGHTQYDKKENKYVINIVDSIDKAEYNNKIFKDIGVNSSFYFRKNCSVVRGNSLTLGAYLKKLGKSHEKYIPMDLFKFSKQDANIFLKEYLMHDGHEKSNGINTISTSSEKIANQIFELACVAGYTPNMHITDKTNTKITIKGIVCNINHKSYNISYSYNKYRNQEPCINLKKHRYEEFYKGYVYCVSVSNENLFVRRKGTGNAVWCGNCLQELARHRTQVLNVQSTRYTLKKMKNEVIENFDKFFYTDLPFYKEYLTMIFQFIEKNNLWELPNDKLKLYMPETLYCKLYMKVNLRNYFNFYELRSSDKAHYLIRDFAKETYKTLPDFIKELVDIYIEGGNNNV